MNKNEQKSPLVCTKSITVNTVFDLNSIHEICGKNITTAIVLGYHEKNDGGGGLFIYDPTLSPNDNDNGLIFDGWKRSIIDSAINVKWFGAKGNGGNVNNLNLISTNNAAFKNAINALRKMTRENDTLVSNHIAESGIFIPSGEYIISADALFTDDPNPNYNFRFIGLNYFSDGNAILSLVNRGNTYAFNNLDKSLFVSFRDITFIGNYEDTNLLYSESNGGAQDYYFERCNFMGKFNRIFTIRGGSNPNTNSEWGFTKCSFYGEINTIMDIKDSDQFLNYWFNETKFWTRTGKTLVADNGGHFKFINCDWSGFSPDTETYLFELNANNTGRGVSDFRITNGRFELKNRNARVLKSNWNQGNIEISADFGSQTFQSFFNDSLKHFEFNLQGDGKSGNSLNINFKNSVMMGYHEFNYKNNSWRGTGKVLYESCSFPYRNTLDNFIKINHGSNNNKSGIAIIEIRNAVFENNYGSSPTQGILNLQISSVDYLPSFKNSGLKKKYFQIAHPATGQNPFAGQKFTLNFPQEAESIITKVKWFLPKNRLGSTRIVHFALTDIFGNIISDDFNLTKKLEINPVMMKDGFNLEQNVYINVKNIPEGKLILKDILNNANQAANEFQCIIEYY